MTFILDMASGTEYQGEEELSCPNHQAVKVTQATDCAYPQLQLAVVEATPHVKQPDSILAGLDIDTLIKDIEN